MKQFRAAAVVLFFSCSAFCFAGEPTIDSYRALESISGYPHSVYMALYKLSSVFGRTKLYYNWSATGPSLADLLKTVDVDPSRYESWIRSSSQ